jgi:hypothetical protein
MMLLPLATGLQGDGSGGGTLARHGVQPGVASSRSGRRTVSEETAMARYDAPNATEEIGERWHETRWQTLLFALGGGVLRLLITLVNSLAQLVGVIADRLASRLRR